MRHLLFIMTASYVLAACAPPTPDVFELYKTSVPVTETAQAKLGEFYDCIKPIDDQANQLEEAGRACGQDYNCRMKISEQIDKLADDLATSCTAMTSHQGDWKGCELHLIKARAEYVHGAPLETGPNQVMADDYLAAQVEDAYNACFAIMDDSSSP